MARTIKELIDQVVYGKGESVVVNPDIIHSYSDHQRELKDLKDIDFHTAEHTGTTHKELLDLHDEFVKAQKEAGKTAHQGMDSYKEHLEGVAGDLKEKLVEKAKDYSYDFQAQKEANKAAQEALAAEHTEALKTLSEKATSEVETLSDKIRSAKKSGTKVNWQKTDFSVADAEIELKELKSRFLSAKEELKIPFDEAMKKHRTIDRELDKVATKIEGTIGHDLTAAVKSEKGFLDTAKNAVHDAKGKGKFNFVKVATLIGAAVLGGHGLSKVLSPESTGTDKTVGFVEVAGGGGLAYAGLKMASHARL